MLSSALRREKSERATDHATSGVRLPRLWVLVGPEHDPAVAGALASVGVRGFQVRDKDGGDAAVLAHARRVIAAVRPHGASVVVDDRVDVALAAGADGVHVGADDLPVADVRRLAPHLLVGATCRGPADVRAARETGADYAGVGPVRASRSKPGLPAPLGVEAIAACARAEAAAPAPLPLVAIGGVDAGTALRCRAAGAHGVAVIGALWDPPDPLVAAQELLTAVR
ncbi:thiamine phosphate synthase [Nocardioides bruguierae]|uniref:Thiamine-phosphate synthase n=1 Tax=Nocardioides bruguierae TaxID=2945102 RepID=A0A9X2D9W7_9ACTN|nr:thiamine phosphate synthase [Nocardioides bruguierae]MCM0622016.1 thiamine phosphate synthase [Nocardioides bruguierae]